MKQTKNVKKTRCCDTCAVLPGAVIDGAAAGQIRIQESAISTMVKRAALSVEGVTRISGSSLIDNLAELVGSRKMQDRAVAICFSGSSVSVEVSLNVLYGSNIRNVAADVQKSITDSIVKFSGLSVSSVSVNIRDMEEPVAEKNEEAEED